MPAGLRMESGAGDMVAEFAAACPQLASLDVAGECHPRAVLL